MTETHRYSVSVAAAVVRDDGRFLAIQRRDNHNWELPGGVLEPGETATDGVVREVEEETGLLVEPIRLSGVYHNVTQDILALVFLAQRVSGELRTTDESVRVDWLTAEQVRDRMARAFAVRLLDAIQEHGPTPVRVHDGEHLC